MTRSLSNVIKAYSIRYNDQDKHVIDTNAVADEKIKYYLDLLEIEHGEKASKEAKPNEGFVEGLTAATIEEVLEEVELSNVKTDILRGELEKRQQSLDEVKEKAKTIIDDAKQEVANMLANAQEKAKALTAQIKEQAKKEGYQEGRNLAKDELEIAKQQLKAQEEKIKNDYESRIKNFEPVIVDLLISYIKRITGVLLEDKKDIILYLIEQELLNIESSNTYLIRVSKDDYDMVHSKKNEISWNVRENAEIEIIEDKMLSRAQCMIETDSRIIDCSLDVQLKNLVHDLKLLAGSRSEDIG